MAKHYGFSDAQRNDLRRLRVVDEQVHELEAHALPAVAHAMRTIKVEGIRKPLEAIRDEADRLAKRLDALRNPAATTAAHAAHAMLWEAHTGKLAEDHLAAPLASYPENPSPDELVAEIQRLASLAERSLARMRGKQARPRYASPWPIRAIDEALLRGWAKKHYRVLDSLTDEELQAGAYQGKPTPAYPFAPRASGGFREIVGCCYVAAGHPNADPEKAIKAYLAFEKKRDAWRKERVKDSGSEK